MQPLSESRNPVFVRAQHRKQPVVVQEPPSSKNTRLPRVNDIERQSQELRSLQLYRVNTQFRQSMFSQEKPTIEECLSKYSFHSEQMESLSRKKLKIIKCGKGIMYLGQEFNDKCHGRGIVVFQDGRLYEGQLENNVRQGEGLYVQADGSWYFGEFSNDKKDGSGTEYHKNYRYKGAYINGLKHGVGFMVTDQIVYSGQWRLGAIHGYGYAQTPESRYQGTFDSFNKHGEGIQYFKNGDVYKGAYFNGKPGGEGHYMWADKSSFQGEFENGKRNGQGVWRNPIGDEYVGNYLNDIKSGEGQFRWKSGNFYKGSFVADKRQGYGEMYWENGSYYKGQWLKGIQNGKGVLHIPPNRTYKGVFKNNVLAVQSEERQQSSTIRDIRKRNMMSAFVRPNMSSRQFNLEKQYSQTQKKRTKKKQLSPVIQMTNHYRNCTACYQKAKKAAEKFRIQKVGKTVSRGKSQSHYIPHQHYRHNHQHQHTYNQDQSYREPSHNHSFRQHADELRSFNSAYPKVPSRLEFMSSGFPGAVDTNKQPKDRSPFRYLKFKFT